MCFCLMGSEDVWFKKVFFCVVGIVFNEFFYIFFYEICIYGV